VLTESTSRNSRGDSSPPSLLAEAVRTCESDGPPDAEWRAQGVAVQRGRRGRVLRVASARPALTRGIPTQRGIAGAMRFSHPA
jgi:hypothetical protein